MNYVKLWGNKIRAKDVVNANGKSIELKSQETVVQEQH